MKKFKTFAAALSGLIVIVVVAVAVLPGLMGVNQTQDQAGGDSNATSTTSTTSTSNTSVTSTTSTSPIRLESGTLVVYFMSYTSSGTSYHTVEGQTLVIESSGGRIFRYLPEQDNLTIVGDFYSPDYARNEIHPYTVDGRLFLVQIWPDSNDAEFYERDPNGTRIFSGRLASIDTNSDYSSWSNYAVSDNRLYYQTKYSWDSLAGRYTGGQLYVRDLEPNAKEKYLLWYDDPANYGSFHSAGGNLYRVNINRDYYLLEINRIDLATGMIMRHLEFSTDNYDDFQSWEFAVDQDAIYIAAQNKSSRVINLWRLSWTDFEDGNIGDFWNSGLVHTHTVADERDTLEGIDADEGYVLLDLFSWGKATFILYDHSAGSATTLHPDLEGTYAQVLKIRPP